MAAMCAHFTPRFCFAFFLLHQDEFHGLPAWLLLPPMIAAAAYYYNYDTKRATVGGGGALVVVHVLSRPGVRDGASGTLLPANT